MENPAQVEEAVQFAANCAAGQCTSLPETNLMRVKVGYDDTFNANTPDAADYLDAMFTHVQTFFCDPSLGSKIQIEVRTLLIEMKELCVKIMLIQRDGDYTYHAGNEWKADGDILRASVKDITTSSSSNAHLFVYMCKDPQFFGTIGIAWVGTLCRPNNWKGYKASINEKRESAISSAEVRIIKNVYAMLMTLN